MNTQELLDAQLALEAESRAIGAARYRKQRAAPWQAAVDADVDEASLPPGRRLLRQALQPTAAAIREFMGSTGSGKAGRKHTAVKLILNVEPEAAAYLTLRCAIQCGVQSLRLQRTSLMIADALLGHIRAQRFEEVNPSGATGLQRALKGRQRISSKRQQAIAEIHRSSGVELTWSNQERLLVGSKLLELAVEATGLVDIVLLEEGSGKQRRKSYEVRLTTTAHDWLERQHARCELLDPLPMPMVVQPRPWTSPTNGGYLDPPHGNRLIRTRNRPYLEELKNVELGGVYAAVNMIQSVRWRVNRQLLAVMREAWEGGGRLGGLPQRDDDPLPPKPLDFETNEQVQLNWKRQASDVHQANARRLSKRMTAMQKMWVAEKLASFPAIYFPHSLDSRGRVYPIPQAGPHPQDGDVGKSLLEFAEGYPLGDCGGRWLTIHLANLFGIDKVSFEERITWVEANEAAILDSASNPLDGQRFWTTADKPWQALAACWEWAGYKADGPAFVSHLPIALDGSNSGLQHFTALLRDANAAPHVNLVPNDRPGDIYARVARQAQALADASNEAGAAAWRGDRITRSIAKRPCMTYAYSVTRQGMAAQIEEALEELDAAARKRDEASHLRGQDNREAALWLSKVMFDLIGETVPAAKMGMDWLRQAARSVNLADIPIWWTTSIGLPVMQRYAKSVGERVNVNYRGRKLQLTLDEEVGPDDFAKWLEKPMVRLMDTRQALSGIAPNFIHSLDAAHLMAVALECKTAGVEALAVIHDSFGTHAANTDQLATILRDTFIRQYEAHPLASFRTEVMTQLEHDPKLQAKVPPLPTSGELDLQDVRNATYMFA